MERNAHATEITIKKKIPPLLLAALLLLAAQIILSFGTPLVWLLGVTVHEVVGFIVLRIFESAGLLLLLMTLGAAFGAAASRKLAHALLLLTVAIGAHFFGTLLALLWQAIFFRQTITGGELALLLGNVLDSSVLPLFVSFLFCYNIFLKNAPNDEPRDFRDTASSPVKAAILASSLIFGYRFLGQVIYAVDFVKDSFGFTFIKPSEKLTVFLDFIPVFAVSAAGYFLLLWARRAYLRLALPYWNKED